MKRYKISKANLKEFFGWFGKNKPDSLQNVIDNDPVLKQLDKELGDINDKFAPRVRNIKKNDPKMFKKLQDIGLISKDFK